MYKCFRCGYTNNLKSNFKRHLRRKNTCKPKLKNIQINEIYNYYFNKNEKLNNLKNFRLTPQNVWQNYPKVWQNQKKVWQNYPKVAQN